MIFLFSVVRIVVVLVDVIDRIHASNDIPKLVGSSNLHLNVFCMVHVPPVPRLQYWVHEFRERHSFAALHSVLESERQERSESSFLAAQAFWDGLTYVSRPNIVPILSPGPSRRNISAIGILLSQTLLLVSSLCHAHSH